MPPAAIIDIDGTLVDTASAADVPTIAVITGGFSRSELEEAGAVAVFESVAELRSGLRTHRWAASFSAAGRRQRRAERGRWLRPRPRCEGSVCARVFG